MIGRCGVSTAGTVSVSPVPTLWTWVAWSLPCPEGQFLAWCQKSVERLVVLRVSTRIASVSVAWQPFRLSFDIGMTCWRRHTTRMQRNGGSSARDGQLLRGWSNGNKRLSKQTAHCEEWGLQEAWRPNKSHNKPSSGFTLPGHRLTKTESSPAFFGAPSNHCIFGLRLHKQPRR